MIVLISTLFLSLSANSADNCKKPDLFSELSYYERAINTYRKICDDNPQSKAKSKYPLAHPDEFKKHNIKSLSVMPKNKLNSVFDQIKNDCRIPFGFNLEGCYSRAHAMAKILEQKGVHSAKVFIANKNGLNLKANIGKKTNLSPPTHAAVVVYAESNGRVQPYVIDPSIYDKPVLLTTFIDDLSPSQKNLKIKFTNRFKYKPNQNKAMNNWDPTEGERAQRHLKAFNRAIKAFKNKDCERLANIVGGEAKTPYEVTLNIKNHCNLSK